VSAVASLLWADLKAISRLSERESCGHAMTRLKRGSGERDRGVLGGVGFGPGTHACVGQMMARLEGDILLSELAARVATLEVTASPQRLLNNTLRGLEKLPMRLK
jgi:hypothetical protein